MPHQVVLGRLAARVELLALTLSLLVLAGCGQPPRSRAGGVTAADPLPFSAESLGGHREMVELVVDGEPVRVEWVRIPSRGGLRRIVCIHGNPSHLEHFAPLVPCLSRLGEVVLFDLPGYGRTPSSRRAPSLAWHADVTAALARALGPGGEIELVGQSFGAGVALTVMARHPALVNSAVLLGSIGYPAHASLRHGALLARIPGAGAVARRVARSLRWVPGALGPFAAPSFLPEPFPHGFVDGEAALIAARPWILATSLAANLGDPCGELAREASELRRPVLFVHGRDDQLVPLANVRALHDRVRQAQIASRLEVVEGGHMVHFTQPERVCPLVERWLGSSAAPGWSRRALGQPEDTEWIAPKPGVDRR